MVDIRAALFVIGILMLVLGAAMAAVGLIDYAASGSEGSVFLISAFLTCFVGAMLFLTNRTLITSMTARTIMFMISCAWLILPAFAALPFMFGSLNLNLTNAYFESVSGMTTTGATILSNMDQLPVGILLWRSLLQWLGGVGVVVMAISALPALRVGGMQIFRMEFSDRLDKAMPRAAQLGVSIMTCYLLLTSLCMILYYFAGMSFFDAVNHAMTTVATGGYSTHDASFLHFDSLAIDLIAIIFMIAGSLPFLHYIQAANGNSKIFWQDSQVRWFAVILLFAIILIAFWLTKHQNIGFWAALRESGFNVVSFMTGTGFARDDVAQWGSFALPVLFVLMFIGGCAGSTTCGMKIFRFQVLAYSAKAQMLKMLQPHSVIVIYYNKRPLPDGVAESVMGFFFFYVMTFGALAIGFGATGLDFLSATSGAVTALANVGPGLSAEIGPSGNFDGLTMAAKWMMCIGMILGRLELFTLLVLILPKFWRD
ncbi:MAG: TrkH family potassium uptake protein [Alphaproteobacteria bacterium]